MPLTPMMQRYVELKEIYREQLLFFRLGDFYELFMTDAEIASRELGLTLTARGGGGDRIPMCGVPHHAATSYIKRLVDRGYSVAMCEQLTAPTKGRGMVERDVVRVITPGTVLDEDHLDRTRNNFVASVYMTDKKDAGSIAWADLSTGEFFATEVKGGDAFLDTIAMIGPKEVIATTAFKEFTSSKNIDIGTNVNDYYDYTFNPLVAHETILSFFGIKTTEIFDFSMASSVVPGAGALLEFIKFTQKKALINISKIKLVRSCEFLVLDKTARDHLEILSQYRESSNKMGSLLWVVDETKTPMGARLLSGMISQPLRDVKRINARHDAIELLINHMALSNDLRAVLSKIGDMARVSGKIASRSISPRDMRGLGRSLDQITAVKSLLSGFERGILRQTAETLTPLPDLVDLVSRAIEEEPPIKLDEGGYIKNGFDATLDEYREAMRDGHLWLSRLEEKERTECGIRELKIGYNRIAGYYFEIPKKLSSTVPYRLTRIATTKDAERYMTEELKQLEQKILGATDKAREQESKVLSSIRDFLVEQIPQITENAEQIAIVDVLSNFAIVADKYNWVRPKMNTENVLRINGMRHPVIEKIIGRNRFIPNDCDFSNDGTSTMVITGPNMAGKSTYMRSVALCSLLAHAGCFVPAKNANISILDRIFTRIGASDSMLTGQSTFMVEMNEVSNILNNATKDSLLLLDEIGRGTGTRDGLALAKAITTYITTEIGAHAMIATHFSELTYLASEIKGIGNFKVTVDQTGENIVFLHKLVAGIEENSFGIDVAKLSGLPASVVKHARELIGGTK